MVGRTRTANLVCSENIIPTLAVIYGAGQGGQGFSATLQAQHTHASALAFLAIQVLFIPCAATIATVRQETKSWRWTLFNVGALFVISLLVGFVIYQAATFWG